MNVYFIIAFSLKMIAIQINKRRDISLINNLSFLIKILQKF